MMDPSSMGGEAEGARTASRTSSTGADREYQLKAAFLYNFIRYTTWPDDAFENDAQPIVLTIVGKDPFEKQIDELFEGKQLHDRSIVIRREKHVPKEVDTHVVFATGLLKFEMAKLEALYHEKPVLVVGEQPEVIQRGAQCNFFIEGGKIRFEVNTDNLELAQLKLSSQLLKLARIVKNEPEDKQEEAK